MEIALLKPLVIIFGISAVVVFALGRLRIPSVIGFILSGFIAGPFGLNLINDIHAIETFAEIGVILLMFTLGLEFSITELFSMKKQVFGAGSLQVGLTILLTIVVATAITTSPTNQLTFYGFLLALSSTAIVLKLLMEKGQSGSPHGRYIIGILLFQDICVVPLMLAIPMLGGTGHDLSDVLLTLFKSFGVLAMVFVAARWLIPKLLREVVGIRSRELFIITILLLCISTALFTSYIGLSLALGAFLAGIIISESEYSAQAISDILPFKESFIALFFISIGMLIDFHFLTANFPVVIGIVLLIIAIKSTVLFITTFALSKSITIAIKTMLYLFQIGEFSFVLATAGKKFQLISNDGYQIFLMSSILTMLVTPIISKFIDNLTYSITSKKTKKRVKINDEQIEHDEKLKIKDHVIIIGFGINGMNLAKTLKTSQIPYCILEMNSKTVEHYKKLEEPIYYGDGTNIEILHKLGIKQAKMLGIVISDPSATRRIVQIARHENTKLYILVRTRYLSEVEELAKLGANEVIPEEFETSIEIFARVLSHYNIPRNIILEHVENIRQDNYGMLRNPNLITRSLAQRTDFLNAIETETYAVTKGSKANGHSIKALELRKRTGVTIIAIQRGAEILQNPSPDTVLHHGDILLLIGNRGDICRAMSYLEGEECPWAGEVNSNNSSPLTIN